jgi:hypothetical protein
MSDEKFDGELGPAHSDIIAALRSLWREDLSAVLDRLESMNDDFDVDLARSHLAGSRTTRVPPPLADYAGLQRLVDELRGILQPGVEGLVQAARIIRTEASACPALRQDLRALRRLVHDIREVLEPEHDEGLVQAARRWRDSGLKDSALDAKEAFRLLDAERMLNRAQQTQAAHEMKTVCAQLEREVAKRERADSTIENIRIQLEEALVLTRA